VSTLGTEIADRAAAESPLWRASLRAEPAWEPVFSPLAEERFGLALETIYEGYLLHYGVSRLFAAADRDEALLLGDALYAQGLVDLAGLGEVEPVAALAELIASCAHRRGEGADGDGEAWAETAASLGGRRDAAARERALATHARLLG
jgi:hypothetical protein